MKVDYVFLKSLLNEMQACESFMIKTDELIGFLYSDAKYSSETEFMEKLYGHIFLLSDIGAVESLVGKNFGVKYSEQGLYYFGAVLRLTARGHDFAKALNDRSFFEKLKKLTIGISYELCKDILTDAARQFIFKGAL